VSTLQVLSSSYVFKRKSPILFLIQKSITGKASIGLGKIPTLIS
jgi:hypothetical protein